MAEEATKGMKHELFSEGRDKIKDFTHGLIADFKNTENMELPELEFDDDTYLDLFMAMLSNDEEEPEPEVK